MDATLSMGIQVLLASGPILVLQGIGVVIALLRWRQHPKVSLAALSAMVLFAGLTLLQFATSMLPYWRVDLFTSETSEWGNRILFTSAMVSALILIVAYICLYYAMFGDRRIMQTRGTAEPIEQAPASEKSITVASPS